MDRNSPLKLTRRQAFFGATLTFGAMATAVAMPAGAATTPAPLAWTPKALTPDQARALEAVAELIIPATDTPGAKQAGVPQFIDRALFDYCEPDEARRIRAGLDRVDQDARATHGEPFAALTGAQQAVLLTGYEREAVAAAGDAWHFFLVLRNLTTVGYFTSEIGATKALRYDPVPGGYRGCVPLSEIGRAWAT